ncbi:MAG: hypothetical protein GY816_13135 [Cytophagales bacterium]|nr:hypothetical protein [Cytophagales bacterium]
MKTYENPVMRIHSSKGKHRYLKQSSNSSLFTDYPNNETLKFATATFYLGTSLRAETDLKSDVGRLLFKFQFSKDQTAFVGSEAAPVLMGMN